MELNQPLNTLHFTSAEQLLEAVESGVSPMYNPRDTSRRAAVQALRCLYDHAAATDDADLQIACRLLATIATINGPGESGKH